MTFGKLILGSMVVPPPMNSFSEKAGRTARNYLDWTTRAKVMTEGTNPLSASVGAEKPGVFLLIPGLLATLTLNPVTSGVRNLAQPEVRTGITEE